MTAPETQAKPMGWIVAAAAAAAVFILDLFAPLDYAVPMLYLLPVLPTWFLPGRWSTPLIAGIALVLIWVGMVLSLGEVTSTVLADRAMASVLALFAAWFLVREKQRTREIAETQVVLLESEERLRLLNDTLEQRVQERAAALIEANERWDWVVRATQDGVWDWDLLHGTAYFSPRWKEMHGFHDSDALESEKEWLARIHPEDRQRVRDRLEEYFTGKRGEFWEEYRIQRKNGTSFWVLDRGIIIRDDQGRAVRMVGAETDITWRKEIEESLHRREQEFHLLANNVPAFLAYVGRDQRYRFVNKRYEGLFGRSVEEIVGLTMFELHGPDRYKVVSPYVTQALRGEPVLFEYEIRTPGDGVRYLSARYVPDRDKHGHVSGFYVLKVDVTELKRSQLVLKDQETQLHDLTARLLATQEEERRRIARDLHDDVTQRLAALSIELGNLRPAQTELAELSLQLKCLGSSAEQLTKDLQTMAQHLHPSILEHAGLEAAVREQVDEFSDRTGLAAEVMVRDFPKDVPLDPALCLYRVLQESLQNVRKHAGASSVLVRLVGTRRGIGLCVHDDGRGFDDHGADAQRKGLGLTSMAERVAALKGTFRIRTTPGDGTELHAFVPLEDAASDG